MTADVPALATKITERLATHTDTNVSLAAHELRALCDPIASDSIAAGLIKVMDGHPPTNPKRDQYNPLATMTIPTAHLRYVAERAGEATQPKPEPKPAPAPQPDAEPTPPTPSGPSAAA